MTVLDNLTTGVVVVDESLAVRMVNSAAEALLDASAKLVSGQPLDHLLPGAEAFLAAVRRVQGTGHPLCEREMQIPLPGGGAITADCIVTPLGDGVPPPRLVIELVPLDRHKRVARDEHLHSLGESAKALLRGLAHEIRNPLGGLRGAAQLLERELDSPELHEYTRVIVHEADRLQALVERMLGPRNLPRLRRMNVHEVTERVCALLAAEAPAGVTVDRDYDPSIPEIDADPDLLIQALLNVARNAVQAVGESGRVVLRTRIRRQVTIGQARHRLAVCVEVADNGPGVPESLDELVFYPMVSGRPDGTGLGLSIAQTLVTQHGGLIECASEPGCTTFSILLPVGSGEHIEP